MPLIHLCRGLAGERSHLRATHLVECKVSEALHVEPIEDQPNERCGLLDRHAIGGGEIERDGAKRQNSLVSKPLEEALERLDRVPLLDPHHAAPVMIDDDREVVLPATVRDLVDAEVHEPVQAIVPGTARQNTPGDRGDAAPCRPRERSDGRAVGTLSEVRHGLLECVREPHVVRRPRDQLGPHAAPRAVQAPDRIPEPHASASEIDVPPDAHASIVNRANAAPAAPA